MSNQKKSGSVDTDRLLQLWSQLVANDRQGESELLELCGLLWTFIERSGPVRAFSESDREDLKMQFVHDKLMVSTGAKAAPQNEAELNAYVRNFSIDWRKRATPMLLSPDDLVVLSDQMQAEQGCGDCTTDDLAAQSVAAGKRSVISQWLQGISSQERDLLWFIQCMEEAAVDVFGRLRILNGAGKVKSLGLRLTRAHQDSDWTALRWFRTTKLGALFRRLSINHERDMKADARQVLRLICEALTPIYQGQGRP